MDDSELHTREMNIGSHIAWGAAMWGSAENSRTNNNFLSAVVSYYYSVFHVSFARINTEHTFNVDSMNRISHNKVEKWIGKQLCLELQQEYKLLREIRESVSYLGLPTSANKLEAVRGHPFGYDLGGERVDFADMLDRASNYSKNIFNTVLSQIEMHCVENRWQPLQYGREYFVEEYLGGDVLLHIIPRENVGVSIIKNSSRISVKVRLEDIGQCKLYATVCFSQIILNRLFRLSSLLGRKHGG